MDRLDVKVGRLKRLLTAVYGQGTKSGALQKFDAVRQGLNDFMRAWKPFGMLGETCVTQRSLRMLGFCLAVLASERLAELKQP